MSAFLNFVTSVCVSAPNSYNEACTKFIDASASQSGVGEKLNQFENKEMQDIKKAAYANLGESEVNFVVGSAAVANAAATHHFVIGIPTLGLCSSLRTEYDQTLYKIIAEWRF